MKKALITGVTGQDGAYLAEFLLEKGYKVHGLKKERSLFNTSRIDHLFPSNRSEATNFSFSYSDLTDASNLIRIIKEFKPDEIYNLAAMSHVKISFDLPEYTANTDALGTLRILEAVRLLGFENSTKIYQASTSELYGKVQEIPQNEKTPFYPRSPYGVAKLYAYWITKNYREAYGIHASNGILFNHESPIRGETFVTRKITRGISNILIGNSDCIFLGNLESKRDWGHAKDFVKAMYLILQQQKADDYVIATGKSISVKQFISLCCDFVGIDVDFKNKGIDEIGYIKRIDNDKFYEAVGTKNNLLKVGKEIIKVDPFYYKSQLKLMN